MIVLTGATGQIGSLVLGKLLQGTEPIRVIARDPSRLPEAVRGRVEIIEGSHGDFETCLRAFDGAERVFWLVAGDMRAPSARAAYVDFSGPGCEAMRRQGVRQVVGISALGRGWPRDAGHVTATLELDDRIAQTGVQYRALTCPSLMENLLRQSQSIRGQGVFFWPMPGDLKAPHCSVRDVATLAASLLLDGTWTGVEEIPVLGPEDLSCDDMARIMTEVLGRPVRFQDIAMQDMHAMMLRNGASVGMAQAMVNMLTAKLEGMDSMVKRTSPGNSPTGFRDWCEIVLKPALPGRDATVS